MKIHNLKKAIGDYKRFNEGGAYNPRYGFLMYEKSSGHLWTDEFYDLGHNSYIVYDDDGDVVNLGLLMKEKDIEVNMKNTKEFIEKGEF